MKPPLNPPTGQRPLEFVSVADRTFIRLVKRHHHDGLGVGWGASRFVPDPGSGGSAAFRALYAASDLDTAFAETVLRDEATDHFGAYPIPLTSLKIWDVVEIKASDVSLVDLRATQMLAARVATDALQGQDHSKGQALGLELHEDPRKPQGLLYTSRLTGSDNIMIFEKAIASNLAQVKRQALLETALFAETLDRFRISIC